MGFWDINRVRPSPRFACFAFPFLADQQALYTHGTHTWSADCFSDAQYNHIISPLDIPCCRSPPCLIKLQLKNVFFFVNDLNLYNNYFETLKTIPVQSSVLTLVYCSFCFISQVKMSDFECYHLLNLIVFVLSTDLIIVVSK